MKSLFIFRHIDCEGPGYLEQVLLERNVPFRLIAIDEEDPLPDSIDDCSGLVFMGGPMSVNDDIDWLQQEIALIGRAIERRLPVLGHCLGGQMIARALGAKVTRNPVKEIGWLPVYSSGEDKHLPWQTHFRLPQTVYHWHGETFALPDGANPLLASDHCEHQAFVYDHNVLAFQCHIEMTRDMVAQWTKRYKDEISEPSETVQSRHDQLEGADMYMEKMHELADTIYSDWLKRIPQ